MREREIVVLTRISEMSIQNCQHNYNVRFDSLSASAGHGGLRCGAVTIYNAAADQLQQCVAFRELYHRVRVGIVLRPSEFFG